MPRLSAEQVAGWLLKSAVPPDRLVPGWEPGELRPLDLCLRASYRLALMRPGAPCVLWCSGRDRPGVHALGVLAAPPRPGREGPEVAVRWARLETPVPRADLLADPAFRDAEVLRMPAGSNPSWLSTRQLAAVLARVPEPERAAAGGPAGTMEA